MNIGFIYCLTNDCMPGICKIGYTDRSPSQRCKELSSSTSAPEDFYVQLYVEVDNARLVEAAAHAYFHARRVNPAREFFRVEPIDLYEWLQRSVDMYTEYLDGDVIFEVQRRASQALAAKVARQQEPA